MQKLPKGDQRSLTEIHRDAFVQQNCLAWAELEYLGVPLSLIRMGAQISSANYSSVPNANCLGCSPCSGLYPTSTHAVLLGKPGREPVDGHLAELPIFLGKGQPSAAL